MLQIAFLTSEYPHSKVTHGGGIGTSIKNLASGLTRLNCKVWVFIVNQNANETFDDKGINIVKLENRKGRFLKWYFDSKYFQNTINEYIRRFNIDLIEVPDWTGMGAFINFICPVVVRLHGTDTYFCYLDKRKVKSKNKVLELINLRKAKKIIGVSHFVADVTAKLFRIERKKISVLHNGVDKEQFSCSGVLPIASKIVYLGTLIRKKGVLEIPHYFNIIGKEVPDAELILVGSDSPDNLTGSKSTWDIMEPLFEADVKERVKYLGKVDYSQVQEILKSASCCIFPSYAEAFPVSWLEAMACGKAIVASAIGWGREVLEDGVSGFLEHPSEHSDFAKKVVLLLHDRSLAHMMGQAARERVVNIFANNIIAQQNIKMYEQVIRMD